MPGDIVRLCHASGRERGFRLASGRPRQHGVGLIGTVDLLGPRRDGDPLARELLGEIGRWLGVGMADLAAALDPGTFVVGGGVSAAGDLLLDPARQAFRRQLTGRGYRPEAVIVAAQLGNEAGLVGAADLARVGAADLAWADAGDRAERRPPAEPAASAGPAATS